MYWNGDESDCSVLVFQLLGPTLKDLFVFCGHQLSLKTVLMIADQFLYRIEYIHSKKSSIEISSRRTS